MAEKVVEYVDSLVTPWGFESYPFQMGWYNEKVTSHFQFPLLDPETLAFVILSVPNMFENAFLPFLAQETDCLSDGGDLIDTCMRTRFKVIILAMYANEVVDLRISAYLSGICKLRL